MAEKLATKLLLCVILMGINDFFWARYALRLVPYTSVQYTPCSCDPPGNPFDNGLSKHLDSAKKA